MIRNVCFGSKGWSRGFITRTTNIPQNLRLLNSCSVGGSLVIRSNRIKLLEYFSIAGESQVKRTFSSIVRRNRFKMSPRNNTTGIIIRLKNSGSVRGENIKMKPIKKTDISRLLHLAKRERWTLLGKSGINRKPLSFLLSAITG